jgi:hypothetical protein
LSHILTSLLCEMFFPLFMIWSAFNIRFVVFMIEYEKIVSYRNS